VLYLHETIDIVGAGQDAYIDAVVRRAAHSEAAGISRLFGCWRVVGSTGRWPQVVNLWEMDGWAHWADGLERQFVPERRDAHLGPWWAEAAQWRRGGFDRILQPAPGTIDRDALVRSGRVFWVCEQTTLRARSGAGETLLSAVMETLPTLWAANEITLIGAYLVPMREDEVVVLAGAPRFGDLCAWYERRDDDPRWRRWCRHRGELAQSTESVWLVPAAKTPLNPLEVRSLADV